MRMPSSICHGARWSSASLRGGSAGCGLSHGTVRAARERTSSRVEANKRGEDAGTVGLVGVLCPRQGTACWAPSRAGVVVVQAGMSKPMALSAVSAAAWSWSQVPPEMPRAPMTWPLAMSG